MAVRAKLLASSQMVASPWLPAFEESPRQTVDSMQAASDRASTQAWLLLSLATEPYCQTVTLAGREDSLTLAEVVVVLLSPKVAMERGLA